MSAYTETLAPILATIEAAESAGRHDAVAVWRNALTQAPSAPRGTMAAWFKARHGQAVETFQWNNDGGKPWAPGARTVSATRAGSVSLNNSQRDYAGMRVIGASESALLVRDGWQTVLYIVAVTP